MRALQAAILLFMSIALMAQPERNSDFDFWIGQWDVYKYGTDTIAGHSMIESTMNGQVIKETYHSASSPYEGISLNKYNYRLKRWEQYYVDNSGVTLHITGQGGGGQMILENEEKTGDQVVSNRITWIKENNGNVRQKWDQSTNGGETWVTVFDGSYRQKK
jgi:hypothetical protein